MIQEMVRRMLDEVKGDEEGEKPAPPPAPPTEGIAKDIFRVAVFLFALFSDLLFCFSFSCFFFSYLCLSSITILKVVKSVKSRQVRLLLRLFLDPTAVRFGRFDHLCGQALRGNTARMSWSSTIARRMASGASPKTIKWS